MHQMRPITKHNKKFFRNSRAQFRYVRTKSSQKIIFITNCHADNATEIFNLFPDVEDLSEDGN